VTGFLKFFLLTIAATVLACADAHAEEACHQERIASLWTPTAQRLEHLLSAKPPPEPRVVFDLGTAPADQDVPENAVIGSYDRRDDTIHLMCSPGNVGLAESTFRHEATHYFLHHAFQRLPSWLEEGMATYMEAGSLDEAGLYDHINKDRLQEFKGLLIRNRLPPLDELISGRTDGLGRSQEYAICWALVFGLLHQEESTVQEQRRALLRRMVEGAQHDDMTTEQSVAKTFFDAIKDEDGQSHDWEMQWRRELWELEE